MSAGSRKPQIQNAHMQKEVMAQHTQQGQPAPRSHHARPAQQEQKAQQGQPAQFVQPARSAQHQHVRHAQPAQVAPHAQHAPHVTLSSYTHRHKKHAPRLALAALGVVVAAVFATGIMMHSAEDDASDRHQTCSSAAFAVEDMPFSTDEVVKQSFFYALGNDTHAIAQTFAAIPAGQQVTAFSLKRTEESGSDTDAISDDGAYNGDEAEEGSAVENDGTSVDIEIEASEETAVASFEAVTAEEIALSQNQLDALDNALGAINAQAAFTLIDAQTGKGIQFNSTTPIYAASSGKAWFSFYLAQRANNGDLSLDDVLFFTETDYPLNSDVWGSTSCVGSLIENTLVYSDNGAYSSLRERYENGYTQWLTDLEIDPVVRADQSWFPFLTPAASVQMWADMYAYMNSDAENASWLAGLLRRTETSFLRDAVVDAVNDAESGQNVSVSNKAGWDSPRYYASYSPYESALCDSGIVEIDGRIYFASFLTGMEENDTNISALENLMRVAFETLQQL